jgi:hypothetical protein
LAVVLLILGRRSDGQRPTSAGPNQTELEREHDRLHPVAEHAADLGARDG